MYILVNIHSSYQLVVLLTNLPLI